MLGVSAARTAVNADFAKVRDTLVISVSDQGPGIPPDNLETIFQRFYTSRPKGTAFGGNSGLGLSIARQIIEAAAGRIYAENRAPGNSQGEGARLIVELPVSLSGG